MTRYSAEPEDPTKSSKARGSHLRVHYKHMREVSHAIHGMQLEKATAYLEDVLKFKRAVPFTMFTGGCGRHAQGKLQKAPGDKCRWPQKATKIVLDLVRNAESNAEMKGLDTSNLFITHIQANRAPKMRRRTYRAHGRINAYMSSPAHIELVLGEKPQQVKKEVEEPKMTRKQAARKRIRVGGGVEA